MACRPRDLDRALERHGLETGTQPEPGGLWPRELPVRRGCYFPHWQLGGGLLLQRRRKPGPSPPLALAGPGFGDLPGLAFMGTLPVRFGRGEIIAARSGDKEAKAKLCRLEIEEVPVTSGPPTGCEVITEAVYRPLLGLRPDSGPHRYSATDILVQVRLGPAPVGLEEAVSAVPRNEHRLHPGSDRAGQLGQRRPPCDEVSDLRQVVTSKPEPATPSGVTGVVREHHHATGHAPHLAQALDRVLPVMNGGNSHRGVEGLVLERKALRGGSHARRRACGTLRTHERRGFHRGDVTAGGLVGAGASPDIHYRQGITERGPDPCGDPRLGAPRHGVRGSDGVIQLPAAHVAASLAVTILTPCIGDVSTRYIGTIYGVA